MRVLSILRLLQHSRSYTLTELASRFGVTTRTIRRDLAALEEVGYGIRCDYDDDGRGGWSLV